MGGNIKFQGKTTRRISSEEYEDMNFDLVEYLSRVTGVPTEWIIPIPFYEQKESFGDIDIIINSDKLDPHWKINLGMAFEIISNSNCHSICYNGVQVDLIMTAQKYFWSSISYFAYNDISNITGRIFHKLGLKHGHKGLSIVIRDIDNTKILKEIELETDGDEVIRIAYEILGLDRYIRIEGIQTLEDIFKLVASSKYFDPEIFSLEHRSGTSRVRDAKRKTYHEFLQWIATTKPEAKYSFADKSELGGHGIRHPYYHDIILKYWPWVEQEVNDLIESDAKHKRFIKYFNGELVQELTGLSGKELGKFMEYMRPIVKSDGFRKTVLDKAEEDRLSFVIKFVEFMWGTYV